MPVYADSPAEVASQSPQEAPAVEVTAEAPPLRPSGAAELELAGVLSYASAPIRGGANPFGAGFGARGGFVYRGWYVGASIVDYVGGSDVNVQYRALLYGVELGYGLRLPAFGAATWVVRPKVGVGDAAVYYTDPALTADVVSSASGSSGASDTITVNNVYVQPGLLMALAFNGPFVALEGGALLLPGIAYGGADATTWVSYEGHLEVGLRF